MRSLKVFCFVIFVIVYFSWGNIHAQSPALQWAGGVGGTQSETVNDMVLDASGYLYITGSFSGSVDFDPGAGISNKVSNGGTDVFLMKLDTGGNLIWVQSIGGTGDDVGYAVCLDVNGNCYVTGSFKLQVDFDPGAGTHNMISAGGDDAFVLKLDSSGNFDWSAAIGGPGASSGRAIIATTSSQLYITGSFSLTTDFDPGTGTYLITSAGNTDGFVCQLDLSGNVHWAGAVGGANSDVSLDIALDQNGNILTTGAFYDIADFDPGPGTAFLGSAGYNDVFIMKWDTSGNLMWVKNIGGPGSDMGLALTTDSIGSVYTTGYFMNTADMDPGNSTFTSTSNGGWDIFILKLDSLGNYVRSAAIGGTGDDEGNDIGLDYSGNLYLTGGFSNAVNFDAGMGNIILNSTGVRDAFITRLDTAGNSTWALQMGGSGFDESKSVTVDIYGNIYASGTFSGTADFDFPNQVNLVSNGYEDFFIAKYNPSSLNLTEHPIDFRMEIYPNPASEHSTVKLQSSNNSPITISLCDFKGNFFYKQISTFMGEFTIKLHSLPEGVYMVMAERENCVEFRRLVVIK